MRIFFNVLAILVVLFTNIIVTRGQNGHLNFSQGSTNNEVATLANTGFGGIRTGTAGGGWSLVNTTSPSIGDGFRLRGNAPSTGSINSVGITSNQYGTPSTTSTISFEVLLNNSPGTWLFFCGNASATGNTFGNAQSGTFTGSEVFAGLRWTVASGGVVTTSYRNGNSWTNLPAGTFAGSTQYTVTVVSNNSASTVNYGSGQSVNSNTFDLWVNGVLVGDNLSKAQLAANTNILAFRFYGENSASNLSNIFLDNIKWWNSCVAPSISIYGSSAPATNTYMDLNVYSDLTLSNPISVLGSVEIPNTNSLTTNSNLTLASNATTTGSLGNIAGTITGNLTVQRFIPSKTTRKWNFLASPVAATVRDSWQQQTFITGNGTGGTPCGTGTGNGGVNDRYNSNGFDATVANAGTVFTYNGVAPVNGSRWEPITSTGFNLVPGRGYRINIRGSRGASNANCTNLINSGTPNTPDAVILAASGPVTAGVNAGTVTVTLDGGNNDFTLLGNPYPSTIDFDLFRATNSSAIFDGFWLYSPQVANSNYTTVNGSTVTNAPSGETATSLKKLASGQAFFVQNIGASNQTVSFQESHKVAGTAGNFRTTQTSNYDWASSMLRLGLQNSSQQLLDELVVRFGANASISNTTVTSLDAANISDFATAIATLKNNRRIAIQTRTLPFVADTVPVEIRAAIAGSYQLVASDFANFTAAESIVLVDTYTQTSTNLKANNSYSFTVTTDPATVGTQRFYLVFRGAATLPVNFTNIFAKYQQANTVQVKWQVASETNIEKYKVEFSTNGTQFSTAAEVIASGNNSQPVNYTAEHTNNFAGITYYRVVAIAKNGDQRISAVAKVSKGNLAASIKLLNNPVSSQLTLLLEGIAGQSTVRINTVDGKLLNQVRVPSQQGLAIIPIQNMSVGTYFVTVTTEAGQILTTKFVKE